jgi:class 3 adenylate cyclase
LVVDDGPANTRLLDAILSPRGYRVVAAASGPEALERIAAEPPDLVLLDILMPGMDGYEVCRRLREDPRTRFLPIVMVTASGEQSKVRAIEAGADDFIPKPVNQAELLARVRSLVRIKEYQDTINAQADELARWNRELEERVRQQVEELDRLGRLRRFLPRYVAEMIVSTGDDSMLKSHRQLVAVAFCDMRGFTGFAERAEPEEVIEVLQEYYQAIDLLVTRFGGTVAHRAGDGMMILFNDPMPCPDPAIEAVRMAVQMRSTLAALQTRWRKLGHELGFGVGIALGFATLGVVGYEGRFDYTANGTVVNLAARLCAEAEDGQILVSPRVHAAVEHLVEAAEQPERSVKGFQRPIAPYAVTSLKPVAAESEARAA